MKLLNHLKVQRALVFRFSELSYLEQAVSPLVDVGPQEVLESVEDFGLWPDQTDVLADGTAPGVFQVLDRLNSGGGCLVVLEEHKSYSLKVLI